VKLPLEMDITTVVGGNESGKSQMLDAVAAALTGDGYEKSDFCRYSDFFSVDKKLVFPEFGALFTDISNDDIRVIEKITAQGELASVDRVALFRMNETPKLRIYVRRAGEWSAPFHVNKPTMLTSLGVPAIYRIDPHTPLPDSVPLEYLTTGKVTAARARHLIRPLMNLLSSNKAIFDSTTTVQENASEISSAWAATEEPTKDDLKRYALAADLLIKVAGLDPPLFAELQEAVRTKNGYANSIVDTINAQLATSLNFPKWWSQDSQFELFVSLLEHELVFMIRDRTGRSYGFDERSDGLKYFLSYFVQYLAHEDRPDGLPEILLMDEPDQFLSSSGQQDLLRIFRSFAYPDNDQRPVQVVYVTHSPFLIDKNHAERIRVLEKGEHDEGTRVVASAAQNHYEPLRSAFGSFVGETAFIGNCNLMLEGPSEQVLLAGISNWLAQQGVSDLERLDLNNLTLVPAGSASQVPYLVYLARGRDVQKPAAIVLLDGDDAGNEARKTIKRGGARRKPLVDDKLVLQPTDDSLSELVSDNPTGPVTIEDLIPFEVALHAAALYCEELVPDVTPLKFELTAEGVLSDGQALLASLESAIRTAADEPTFHLDKIAFARCVIEVVRRNTASEQAVEQLAKNFRLLNSELGKRQRLADSAERQVNIQSRIKRAKERFLADNPTDARREQVIILIEYIERQLDDSYEADMVITKMRKWRQDFKLSEDPRSPVENYDSLVDALNNLTYLPTVAAESHGSPEFGSVTRHASVQTSTEDDERSSVQVQDADVSDAKTG
jgi:energy-coupling factor transporter ATP-binding protein EcfA2